MSHTKEELLNIAKKGLWLEEEMRDIYASYKGMIDDERLANTMQEIEADEMRHINMINRVISILQK